MMMKTTFNKMQRNFIVGTLCLGRLVGVIRHTNLKNLKNLKNGVKSLPTFYSTVLTAFYLSVCIKLLSEVFASLRDDELDIFGKMNLFLVPSYHLQVFLTYTYFLTTATYLTCLLKEWNDISERLVTSFNISYWSHQNINLVSETFTPLFLLALGIMENIVYDLKCFKLKATLFHGKSLLEKYFFQSGLFFANYVSYSPVLSLLFIIFDKAGVMVWNFGGIVPIVFCRLCTQQLRLFGDLLRAKIGMSIIAARVGVRHDDGSVENISDGKIEWEKIRESFITLCGTLQKVVNYVAPLVLLCYIENICEIICDVFIVLSGNLKRDSTVSIYVSVFQLTLRISLITYHVSEMHNSFERIAAILSECPGYLYDISTQRLERYLDNRPLGMYLFGSFLITRQFFISIISFICTTEIILMQSMTVSGSGSNDLHKV